jgi:hypothetical protein
MIDLDPGTPEPASVAAPEPVVIAQNPPRRGGGFVSVLLFILILALGAGEAYLWQRLHAAGGAAVAALQAQIDTLRQKRAQAPAAPASAADDAQMDQKFDALTAQVSALQSELAADHGVVTTLQASTADLGKLSTHMEQLDAHVALLNRLALARLALDNGQPIGQLPNAPPALAQFATTAPPTEASLRLGFPNAARAAAAASVSADGKLSFWSRAVARMESIVTVSDGTHVLVGAPAAGVLDQARVLLDAGDLTGAVNLIDTLSLPTQTAMGDWWRQAQALVAARAALTSLAGRS